MFLLVFNWFGYRVMVDYLQQKVDTRLENHLNDNQYDESQMIEIKIPLHLPYQSTWSSYERYDGEVEFNGSYYKYVKRKLADDTLYLKCINNPAKSRLELAKNDFFKNTNDVSQSSNKSDNNKSSLKKASLDYDDHFSAHPVINNVSDSFLKHIGLPDLQLPHPGIAVPWQPPETA